MRYLVAKVWENAYNAREEDGDWYRMEVADGTDIEPGRDYIIRGLRARVLSVHEDAAEAARELLRVVGR